MNATPEQLNFYAENGYLVLPNFVTSEACKRLRHRAAELVSAFEPGVNVSVFDNDPSKRDSDRYFLESGDKVRCFFEDGAFGPDGVALYPKDCSINKIGHALHDLDPVFRDFSRTSDLARLCSDLGFHEPLLLQSMYIFKQPRIGGAVNAHQDSSFLYTDPPSVTGFWFALDDADRDNGCLWALPGGHRQGLKARYLQTDDGAQMETWDPTPWPEQGWMPLEAREGTLVILHGSLPHRSEINHSSRPRAAYTLHLVEGAAHYPDDNWLQRSKQLPMTGF